MTILTRRAMIKTSAGAAFAAALPMPAILANDPIKIGVVQPFSGGLELFGNQAKLGLDLAVSEINGAGGIGGRSISLIYEDDKTDPKTAVERATQLVRRDSVLAISGPITSNNRDAMMPTLSRAKTPLLYATNYEGGGCDRYLFSFNTVPNQELEKLLPVLKTRTLADSIYMFGADYVWPQKMFAAAETLATASGMKVAGKEFTPWGVKDFAPTIRKIKDSGAKVLLFALPGADGITFIRQAEDLGLMKDVTIGFLGFAETYLGAFGEGKGQNMWVTVPFAASMTEPGPAEFVAKIKKAAPDAPISHYAYTHYNSMLAVKAALDKAGKVDAEALVDNLENLTFKSPTGDVTIGKDHHVTMPMYLAKTEGAGLKVEEALGAIAPVAGCA
jgi:urea transport system substrate-binding protein